MAQVLKDPWDPDLPSPDAHDADTILGGLSLVFPYEGGDPCGWDLALDMQGPPLFAKAAAEVKSTPTQETN